MSIGDKIRELRESLHLTQEDVAKGIGTTKQNIYKYEMGIITNIPLDKVEALSQFFYVSPAYLTGWSDDKGSFGVRTTSGSAVPRLLLDFWMGLNDDERNQLLMVLKDGPIADGDLKLLSRYHLLTHDNQVRILERIESLLEDQPSTEEKQPSAG